MKLSSFGTYIVKVTGATEYYNTTSSVIDKTFVVNIVCVVSQIIPPGLV